VVLLLAVACWLPYFPGTVRPFHDSAYVYECFHYLYNGLVCNGEFARWAPYGNYGTQTDLYQTGLHPTAYTLGLLGLLFHVKNTLVLFKASILVNEALLAFGLYLLGGELYRLRLTRLLIAVTGVLSVSWLQQSLLNLGVFYLLPLTMYFLVRFFKTGRAANLGLAALVEICSNAAGVPYFAPLKGLVLLVFAVPLCFQYQGTRLRVAIRTLLTRKTLLHPCLWAAALAAAVAVCYLAGIQENLVVLSPGRDPTTGHVTLDTFLNYGRLTVATTLAGFVTGGISHADNTYYVGLLPLAMTAYALVTQKDKAFLGIICAFAMLFWLSLGGTFATAVYYLPGLALFRHVGLVFGLGSLLLLLASGYGIDRLAGVMSESAVAPPPRLAKRLAWLGLVAGLIFLDFWNCRRPNDGDVLFLHPAWKPFFAFRLLVYAAAIVALVGLWLARRQRQPWALVVHFINNVTVTCSSRRVGQDRTASAGPPLLGGKHDMVGRRSLRDLVPPYSLGFWLARRQRLALVPALLLGVPFLLDMGSFRAQVLWTMPAGYPLAGVAEESSPGVFQVAAVPYQTHRRQQPPAGPAAVRFETMTQPVPPFPDGHHSVLYGFSGWDPCVPDYKTDYLSAGVFEMLRARGGEPTAWLAKSLPPDDEALEKLLGGGMPKLRLVRRVQVARTAEEARGLFAALPDPTSTTVLLCEDPQVVGSSKLDGREPAGSVEVQAFSSNRLDVRTVVEGKDPAWLVYADAWHPGWKATVDGRPVPVVRANLGFKAVQIESGMHDVRWQFDPRRRTCVAWCFALLETLFGSTLCCALAVAVARDLRPFIPTRSASEEISYGPRLRFGLVSSSTSQLPT
jgi:hypothetical protein